MKPIAFGDFEIREVVEEPLPISTNGTFGDFPRERMAEHLKWLPKNSFTDAGEAMLVVRSFIVRSRTHTVLADACHGNHKKRMPMRDGRMQGHMLNTPFLEDMARAGVKPEDVDFVFCTHFHLDHVGWNTKLVDGKWVPTFPRARYLLGQAEWDYFVTLKENEWGYDAFTDSVRPVVDAGQAVFFDDSHAIEPGLFVEPLRGHTPGHAGLHMVSRERHAVFTGDMIHHAAQIPEPDWGRPKAAQACRRAFNERYADTGTLIIPAHFPDPVVGYIVRAGESFRFEFGA